MLFLLLATKAKHIWLLLMLWHCRLAHISKKHIEKMQQEGLLRSTDDESFDQCVSCLIVATMTMRNVSSSSNGCTDLLGIIHTDVCVLLRHMSRQGASYFITFTYDYSCYGYVYLLKHKLEVFETLKVFKNEVENQLEKTIKEVSGRAEGLEEIQDEDTSPSGITSEIPMEVEGFEPPQEEVIPIHMANGCQNWPYLNGHLDEDIYMVQPEGFVDPNHPRKVCKLQRSIYGLKQASRSWNKRFDEEIKRFGFTQNLDEPWEAAFILGIKIYRDRSKRLIGLSQNAYMDKILKRYKMDNSKRGTIPIFRIWFKGTSESMFPIYRRLLAHRLPIFFIVGAYVLKMKDYVEQLERLGYVLPQDLSVALILNGLTSDFTGSARNYNVHNMGKTIGELHAMLIEYEKRFT
ncbi:retrotransposon protein, putative, ty1-copia subclass [Tanacetum coccineum]